MSFVLRFCFDSLLKIYIFQSSATCQLSFTFQQVLYVYKGMTSSFFFLSVSLSVPTSVLSFSSTLLSFCLPFCLVFFSAPIFHFSLYLRSRKTRISMYMYSFLYACQEVEWHGTFTFSIPALAWHFCFLFRLYVLFSYVLFHVSVFFRWVIFGRAWLYEPCGPP